MGATARLAELGIVLPGPYPPHDPLDAVVVHGNRARTSGQLPRDHAGALVHPGTLGQEVTVAEGAEAARWCALNALSVLRAELGDLDRIERVLSVLGFVACTPGFDQQAAVVDGAGPIRRFVSITLPMLKPTLIFVVVTSTIGGPLIWLRTCAQDSDSISNKQDRDFCRTRRSARSGKLRVTRSFQRFDQNAHTTDKSPHADHSTSAASGTCSRRSA